MNCVSSTNFCCMYGTSASATCRTGAASGGTFTLGTVSPLSACAIACLADDLCSVLPEAPVVAACAFQACCQKVGIKMFCFCATDLVIGNA